MDRSWSRMEDVVLRDPRESTDRNRDELLRRMYVNREGTIKQIARRVGRSPAAVSKMIERRGWSHQRVPLSEGQHPCSRLVIYGERREALLAEVRSGVKYHEIAKKYGVCVDTVSDTAIRAGIWRRKRKCRRSA